MKFMIFILFFISSCENSKHAVNRNILSEVGVQTSFSDSSRKVLLPEEAIVIKVANGTMSAVKGSYTDPVVIELASLDSGLGEGLTIKTVFLSGDRTQNPVPQQDLEICIMADGEPSLKDIQVTSDFDKSVTQYDGFVKDSEICILTRVVSGSFEAVVSSAVIPSDLATTDNSDTTEVTSGILLNLNQFNDLGSLDIEPTHDLSVNQILAEHVKLLKSTTITGAIEIEWGGDDAVRASLLSLTTAKICLNTEKNIRTVTQIHEDGAVSHTGGTLIENKLCLVPSSLYGHFILGPPRLEVVSLDTVNTVLASDPKIDVSPMTKEDVLFIYSSLDCSGTVIKSQTALDDGGMKVELNHMQEGLYSLYSQILSKDGAIGECQKLIDLVVDTTAPASPVLTIDGGVVTSDAAPNLILSAIGASEMYITNTSGCGSGGSWENYATAKADWPLGQSNAVAKVYVKFKDVAGNESNCVNDTITHDATAPTNPTMTISSGAAYTTSSSVTLSPSSIDASEMYITNISGCGSGGSWENYATTKAAWALGQGNATATVYVKFKDTAGNESTCENDTIIHDNTAPSNVGLFADGTDSKSLTESADMTWNASFDGGSGVASYEISIGSSLGATDVKDWTDVGNILTASLTGFALSNGTTYYANIRALDSAGNISSVVSGDGFSGNVLIDCSGLSGGTWIGVPGDVDYGTSDFCVMKYEAKNVANTPASNAAGLPWENISHGDSITECSSLGTDHHLITNEEWMTIAANVAYVDDNWSGGTVGSGLMNRGHTGSGILAASSDDNDPCVGTGQTCDASTWDVKRRTHKLSNGEVIWDLSGNVYQWVNAHEANGKVSPLDDYREYSESLSDGANWSVTDLIPRNSQKSFWDDSWDLNQGLGSYYPGLNGDGGAMLRGGSRADGVSAGVFAVLLNIWGSVDHTWIGFRCAAPAS
ncbi:MAG: hypothetical protein AB8C84_02840 [Oligoflexales bacterium]